MAGKKKKLWILPMTVGIAIVLAGGFMVCRGFQEKKKESEKTAPRTEEAGEIDKEKETLQETGDVIWKGQTYVYNDHLSNFLFIGVDKKAGQETSRGQTDAGQADSIFLISWDRVEADLALITIPRDTMTDIETFDVQGNSLGKSRDHLSLAYAFGDGGNESCQMTKEAVSNLLYGLPIQGYCSLNLDSIPLLVKSVGEVAVTVPDKSLEQADPAFKAGEEVILTEENVETFLRYRNIEESQSAIERMERQKVFLEAYAKRAGEVFQEDAGFVTKLYTSLTPYMTTNMGNDQFVKLFQDALGKNLRQNWTIPGEGVQGSTFDEYHVDDEALYEKILETFYVKTGQEAGA